MLSIAYITDIKILYVYIWTNSEITLEHFKNNFSPIIFSDFPHKVVQESTWTGVTICLYIRLSKKHA